MTALALPVVVCAQDGVEPLMSEEFKVQRACEFDLLTSDGSFDAFFNRHFAEQVAELKLESRTVIEPRNPYLPA